MPTISQLIHSAVNLHRKGQLDAARRLCEQILLHDPRNAGTLNLGPDCAETGQFPRAIEYLKQAIAIDATQAAFYANLGEAPGLQQLPDAIECYRHAVRLAPEAFDPHNNLGTLFHQAGSFDEAIASYERALQIQPQSADANFNLGCALRQQDKLHPASVAYRRAIEIDPNYVRAWINLGGIARLQRNATLAQACFQRAAELAPNTAAAHFNLGNVYQEQSQFAQAIECYRRALELDPQHADTHCNLGNALREQGQLAEAASHLQRAVQLRPDAAAPHSNLGVTFQDLGRLAEAKECLETAIRLDPDNAVFHFNLGTVIKDLAHPAAAMAHFDRALDFRPELRSAYVAAQTALLAMGDFVPGWAGYEHRVNCPQFDTRKFPEPIWDGQPLGQRTLLIHCEQGFGDTLQFIRYAKLARARGEKTIVTVQGVLLPLLAQSGFQGLISTDDPLPSFNVHAPLMSLPHIFRTALDSVPRDIPYLAAEPARVTQWREKLANIEGVRVGIAWQGRLNYRGDRFRSIPLAHFAPLAAVPGVRLLSLQKGPGTEQLGGLQRPWNVVELGSALDNEGGAFLDTAAVMKNLDLVITSDTAMAHLAGALGVPVWVALSAAPDWRWMLEREDSPWYPSMRLFRQTRLGHWPDVFERMADELRSFRRSG